MDVGVHGIDTLRFILGEVRAVTALVASPAFHSAVGDTATVLLQFQNGAQAVVSAAFSVAGVDPETLGYLELCGTGGRIWTSPLYSKDSSGVFRLLTARGEERFAREQPTHVAMIEAFARAVETGEPVPVSGVEGLRGLMIVEASYRSSQTGQTILLPE